MKEHESSSTIATCYLRESGNEKNKVWLSPGHLQLLYKGQLKVFPLEQIQSIGFNHRKLMLPLIIGGIAATLSLVAIIKLYYTPWLMLSLLTAGCLSTYRGYLGTWALTIQEKQYHTDFFIKSVSVNLEAFVKYANTFTGHQPGGVLYMVLPATTLEKAGARGFYSPERPHRLYYRSELSSASTPDSLTIAVNSLDDSIIVNWQPAEAEQKLHPFLQPKSVVPLTNGHSTPW